MQFIVDYDRVADALYIKLRDGRVAYSEEAAPGVIVDYDEKGEIIGIEVIGVSKRRLDLREIVLKGPEALAAMA